MSILIFAFIGETGFLLSANLVLPGKNKTIIRLLLCRFRPIITNMVIASINYLSSVIHFSITGNGDQIVFCFHGYGEEGAHFNFLAEKAGREFTFIAMDLPFHGKTVWKEKLLTAEQLAEIMDKVIQAVIPERHAENKSFFLLGFSLGARVALSLYQARPDRFKKIVLLAPDGLKVNCWYWLSTQTWMGNRLFAFTLQHPGWFFGSLKILNRLRLVNTSIFKFVNYYIGDPEVRRLLYVRWMTLRKLKPSLKKIRYFILEKDIPVRLIYGKHDRIILPQPGERFRNGIKDNCTIVVVDAGHQVLHPKNENVIIQALLQAGLSGSSYNCLLNQ